MTQKDEFKAAVLNLTNQDHNFDYLALEIFRYQASKNKVYSKYLHHLNIDIGKINRLEKIPCLPISLFKYHEVVTQPFVPSTEFRSSGTSNQQTSTHLVEDLTFYEYNSLKLFEKSYGGVNSFHIFALLPNYLERDDSSLVYMAKSFMLKSFSPYSGFYLNNFEKLLQNIEIALESDTLRRVLLIGVTFALLDLAEQKLNLNVLKKYADRIVIMETGGMKGRRKEMLRDEVHSVLQKSFGAKKIHSEYGMTELLSQAYSHGDGDFECSATMKILLREVNDPFSYLPSFKIGNNHNKLRERGKTGGINVIDLANIDSCCFIETQDLGAFSHDYKYFKVLGRFDNSEVRGCNLMVSY